MTDRFESEVQKFVSQQNGDDLTPQIVYGMLQAVDEDANRRHQETVAAFKEHCTEAVVRDLAIRELQDWRRESSEHCQERIERIVRAEHGPVHAAHMAEHHGKPRRMEDPPDSEFTERRESAFPTGDQRSVFEMILGWNIVKWLVALAVGAVIVWGVSYWASSCAAQKVEEDFIHSGGEVHLIVPSPSPDAP